MYMVLREKLGLFAQRYKDSNSYLDNIGSKIRKHLIILATRSFLDSGDLDAYQWKSLDAQFYANYACMSKTRF